MKDAGFERCTPIQAQVLPVALAGKDIAGQAQTGTGKTAAFLVPMFSKLLGLEERNKTLPSALIVAPTRELALQIFEEAVVLGGHTDFTIAQAIGGMDYRKQMDILKEGVDILIGTPGRIIDYYKQGVFKTHAIKSVVIDEADRLLDLGFAKDMRYILRKMPHYEKTSVHAFFRHLVLPGSGTDLRLHEPSRVHIGHARGSHGQGDRPDFVPCGPGPETSLASRGFLRTKTGPGPWFL